MTGRRAAAALRGLAAMITLLALVIGLPAVLYRFGGNPVPHRLPSLHQVSHTLLQRDSGALFLGIVRDISWIAWALFSLAVVIETLAAVRGRQAPRLRLGGLQHMAGQLVAVAAMTFSSPATALLAASAGPVAVATVSPHDSAASGTLAGPNLVTLTRVPDSGALAASGQGALTTPGPGLPGASPPVRQQPRR